MRRWLLGVLFVMRRSFVFRVFFVSSTGLVVLLVQLLGALGALEFMALAGNSEQRNGHKQDGE